MLGKLELFTLAAIIRIKTFFKDEDGEVNIVAIVILIGIAVILAILFRDYISNLLKLLFKKINNSAQNAI